MPFDSHVFVLFFLPLLVLVWRAMALVRRESLWLVLLASSLLFCLWASPAGLVIMGLLVPVNYGLGLALAAPGEREGSPRRRGLLALSLLVTFAPLVLVRYFPLLWSALPALAADVPFWPTLWGGLGQGPLAGETQGFVLQTAELAGLSFFCLVQSAWLVSVYRRHLEPEGLLRHALFSFAFPYLLAGPVVRYEQMGRQFDTLNAPPLSVLVPGLGLFVTGLAKKVLLADWLAAHADTVFAAAAAGEVLTPVEAWLGLFSFSFQIYFDFSAYTDMALGVGLMLGLRLPENFVSPYRAPGFIEFWRRWHVTFSTWLRDMIFRPLAGEWGNPARVLLAIAGGLLVAGLWHGSSATFLVWAAIHAVFLALNYLFRSLRGAALDNLLATLPARFVCALVTFALVTLAWVVFRADNPAHALAMYDNLFRFGQDGALSFTANGHFGGWLSLIPLLVSALTVFFLPTAHDVFLGCRDGSRSWLSFSPNFRWAALLAAAAFLCLAVMDRARPFIF